MTSVRVMPSSTICSDAASTERCPRSRGKTGGQRGTKRRSGDAIAGVGFLSWAEQAVKQSSLARPSFLDRLAWHPPGCEAERQRDDHNVVERPDHGKKLRDQIDRADHPHCGDRHGDLGGARNPRVLA